MKLLVHTCCAGCLADSLASFRRESDDLAVYWYNPNIHPLVEYRKRLKSVRLICERLGLELIVDDPDGPGEGYGLIDFIRAVAGNEEARCRHCHSDRLLATGRKASELGFDAFTTTLSVSRHQDHVILKEAGRASQEATGVRFLYMDLRALHGSAESAPSGLTLHRQKYCGCIYSEFERFRDLPEGMACSPGGAGAGAEPEGRSS